MTVVPYMSKSREEIFDYKVPETAYTSLMLINCEENKYDVWSGCLLTPIYELKTSDYVEMFRGFVRCRKFWISLDSRVDYVNFNNENNFCFWLSHPNFTKYGFGAIKIFAFFTSSRSGCVEEEFPFFFFFRNDYYELYCVERCRDMNFFSRK